MAVIRSSAAMDPLASTTNMIKLPILLSRTFSRKSQCSMSRAVSPVASCLRRFWKGAAARNVASNAKSSIFPFEFCRQHSGLFGVA